MDSAAVDAALNGLNQDLTSTPNLANTASSSVENASVDAQLSALNQISGGVGSSTATSAGTTDNRLDQLNRLSLQGSGNSEEQSVDNTLNSLNQIALATAQQNAQGPSIPGSAPGTDFDSLSQLASQMGQETYQDMSQFGIPQ